MLPPALQFGILRLRIPQRLGIPRRSVIDSFRHLLPVWGIYLVFFLLTGAILYGLVLAIGPLHPAVPIQTAIASFAASWLTGFVTPGAPAGIGVRESIIILTLSPFLGQSTSALVALEFRLVTTLGDICLYFLATLAR